MCMLEKLGVLIDLTLSKRFEHLNPIKDYISREPSDNCLDLSLSKAHCSVNYLYGAVNIKNFVCKNRNNETVINGHTNPSFTYANDPL